MQEALVPGGVLLDMRPGLECSPVLASGEVLGRLDEQGFISDSHATDASLAASVASGLFEPVGETGFVLVHRFDDSGELVEEVGNWRRVEIPARLRERLAAARAPFEVRERCVLCRLRAL
jgi:hypothetical protein